MHASPPTPQDPLNDPTTNGIVDAPERSLPHPIATLMNEHRTILAVLAELEQRAADLHMGNALDVAWWRQRLLFLEVFDEQLHHDKEEGVLFPALEAAGLSTESGPTAILRSEHGRARLWRQSIAETLTTGDGPRLLAAVQGFVDLQRQHILKENQILLPLARHMLTASTFAQMAILFVERDDGVAPRTA